MNDIFSDDNKITGNWWKKDAIGASISGTFIGKRQAQNNLSGNMEWVYELRTEDGEIWNVGGKPAIDMQMRHIQLGQIIGFKFTEERPARRLGNNPTKIIQVFAPKDSVDQEWLDSEDGANAKQEASANVSADVNTEATPEATDTAEDEIDVKTIPFADTPEEKTKMIIALAQEKLGCKEADVRTEVMKVTKLGFVDSNLDAIIGALNEMK